MRYLRVVVVGLLTGMLALGSVWAGIGLGPVSDTKLPGDARPDAPRLHDAGSLTASGASFTTPLPSDQLLAGAAKIDIYPAPDASRGDVWVRDRAKCATATAPQTWGDHVADFRNTWIENTNCIYMGGFGIGPAQPVITWDCVEGDTRAACATDPSRPNGYGLWARSAAFVRDGKAVVVTILDGEGYFGAYRRMCGATPCGAFDLAAQLATRTGLDPASFVFASTHAHSAIDFIGGWGGVPEWYMRQVSEAMRTSVLRALGVEECPQPQDPAAPTCVPLQPATLEAGDTLVRAGNAERRAGYRSPEDSSMNWIRARTPAGATIATVGAYAAHPTSFGASATRAHADWPGIFAENVENRFGGIGLMFVSGLGNMSGGGTGLGTTLSNAMPPSGTAVSSPTVGVKESYWDQPITNGPLGSLGSAGFFDRAFGGPASVEVAESATWKIPCRSASPVSVRVSVTAARIGNVMIAAAPGEIFGNYSNTLEEWSARNRGAVTTLVLGQADDALGYMPQSFETDDKGRTGAGFADTGAAEYEDAYSIDRCFGDMALETTIKLLGTLP